MTFNMAERETDTRARFSRVYVITRTHTRTFNLTTVRTKNNRISTFCFTSLFFFLFNIVRFLSFTALQSLFLLFFVFYVSFPSVHQ